MIVHQGNLTVTPGDGRSLTYNMGLVLFGVILGFLSAGPTFTLAQRSLQNTSPYKGYSGLRLSPQSNRMVYYQDQTIAVVELGPNRELVNCELIEVYKDSMRKAALKNLTVVAKSRAISFPNMMDLMERCHRLRTPNSFVTNSTPRGSSLLSGVLPGTKWCGTGDIAANYFDLGQDENIDRCCRTHDLCPVKVRANNVRYNLTNESIYTKSHCKCDIQFHKCLKESKHPTADAMGNIYFNILRVPCIQNKGGETFFQPAKRY